MPEDAKLAERLLLASFIAWWLTHVERCMINVSGNSLYTTIYNHVPRPSQVQSPDARCISWPRNSMTTLGWELGHSPRSTPSYAPSESSHRLQVIKNKEICCPRLSCTYGRDKTDWTYCNSFGASRQFSGIFLPGCGHAGHSTAHSPSAVADTPAGSCPRPARLSIFRWRHSRIIRRNSS